MMDSYLTGTWLYTIFTMLPLSLWAIYSLSKEGWMSRRGPAEKLMTFLVWFGLVYQVLLPFYWIYELAPKGM